MADNKVTNALSELMNDVGYTSLMDARNAAKMQYDRVQEFLNDKYKDSPAQKPISEQFPDNNVQSAYTKEMREYADKIGIIKSNGESKIVFMEPADKKLKESSMENWKMMADAEDKHREDVLSKHGLSEPEKITVRKTINSVEILTRDDEKPSYKRDEKTKEEKKPSFDTAQISLKDVPSSHDYQFSPPSTGVSAGNKQVLG